MSSHTPCTSDQALRALSALQSAFGGYPIPDDDKREFLRLFGRHTAPAVRRAIDEAVERFPRRRPAPNELAELIRLAQPPVRDTRTSEPWPPMTEEGAARVSERIQAIKARAGLVGTTAPTASNSTGGERS